MNAVKVTHADDFQEPLYTVRQTSTKGRAIFARQDIPKHSVILQSQAILLQGEDYGRLGETSIWPYRFALGEQGALVFGDISFCNHSDAPNASVSWTRLTPTAAVASLIALTDISANAEIEISYSDAEEYRNRGVKFS